MDDALLYTQGLTDSQRMMFLSQYNAQQKNPTTGVLLALFLGGFGGHRFYMGQVGLGVAYLLFCWTFIPACIAFVEMFLMSGRVKRFNNDLAMHVLAQVKSLS